MSKSGLKYLYIFTFCFVMYFRLPGINLPWYFTYIHCVIWIGLFFVLTVQNGFHKKDVRLIYAMNTVKRLFFMPYLIFVFFTMIGWIYYRNSVQTNMVTRTISSYIQFALLLCSVLATAYFFREKLLKYTFIAMLINYFSIMLLALFKYGISDFISTGLLPFSDAAKTYKPNGTSANMLEVHDVTFAAGFYLIYFLLWGGSEKRQKEKNILLSVFLIYIGYKRIELAALALLAIFTLFIKKKSKRSISFWIVIYTGILLTVLYLFLWVIDTGVLEQLAEKFGINFMGRLDTYAYMAQYCEFSPLYMGRGMAAAIRYNLNAIEEGIRLVQGHSDILFNYIDFGFWGFTSWVLYCGYFAARRILKRHGTECAKLWILFTTYAFITYLTDNTSFYFCFQTSYIALVFHAIYTKGHAVDVGQDGVGAIEEQI